MIKCQDNVSMWGLSALILFVVSALKCFSDVAMEEVSRCEQRKGFRSCFIKYDQGESVSG